MNLLLISVRSDTALGGIAVWTEHFLSRTEQLDIHCSLINTELIGSRIKTGRRNFFDELLRTCRIFKELRRHIRRERFDAAYLNTSCGNFGLFRDWLIARLIEKRKIPLLTQYHCELPYWIRSAAAHRCLGKLAAISKQNLVLCQNSKEYLQREYGIDSLKIPNFVDESTVLRTKKEIRPQITSICFVGRVSETKGAAEIYAVAKQLPHITFSLFGDISPVVQTWDKPDNIILAGSKANTQIISFLDEADLFLLPSHTEGCSIALMEAMARGVPCIATDVGANADMLGNGCGIIVNKTDASALLQAIDTLQDPELRAQMSLRCTEKVTHQYTSKNVDAIIRIIESIES